MVYRGSARTSSLVLGRLGAGSALRLRALRLFAQRQQRQRDQGQHEGSRSRTSRIRPKMSWRGTYVAIRIRGEALKLGRTAGNPDEGQDHQATQEHGGPLEPPRVEVCSSEFADGHNRRPDADCGPQADERDGEHSEQAGAAQGEVRGASRPHRSAAWTAIANTAVSRFRVPTTINVGKSQPSRPMCVSTPASVHTTRSVGESGWYQ